MLWACYVYAGCALCVSMCMLCACYVQAVCSYALCMLCAMCMLCACYVHAVCMLCACYLHAMGMLFACYVHAMCTLCTFRSCQRPWRRRCKLQQRATRQGIAFAERLTVPLGCGVVAQVADGRHEPRSRRSELGCLEARWSARLACLARPGRLARMVGSDGWLGRVARLGWWDRL